MEKQIMEQVFAVAIGREVKAYEFYKKVAAKAVNEAVKKTFEELAGDELTHREKLETLLHDPTRIMKFNQPKADYKVAEATPLPDPSIEMKPADAIVLAMKKEQEAVEFYRQLALDAADEGIKLMFDNLANMELNHKIRLENVYVEIGYPEVF